MDLEKKNTQFIGFTSSVGGAGTTSAAIVFARICARIFGKRILVLSFDGLSSKMAPIAGNGSFVKGVFVNVCGGKDAGFELKQGTGKDEFGVSYLTDAGYFNPLPELSLEDLYFCLESIASSGDYDIAVLDFPFQSLKSVEICALCEKIVFCTGRGCTGSADAEAFQTNFQQLTAEMLQKPKLLFFSPEEDPESFSEGVVDIHGQFGAEVRELAAELLEM